MGKRKRYAGPAQSYHGSGRTHLHLLVWLKNMSALDWPRVLRADLAEDEPEMQDLVAGSQSLDYDSSAWPLHEGPTTFDSSNGRISLHHPRKAKAAHVRAFMPRCHCSHAVPHGRADRRRASVAAAVRRKLRSKIQRLLRHLLVERRSLGLPLGSKDLDGVPSFGAGDVAAAGRAVLPPSHRNPSDAASERAVSLD